MQPWMLLLDIEQLWSHYLLYESKNLMIQNVFVSELGGQNRKSLNAILHMYMNIWLVYCLV